MFSFPYFTVLVALCCQHATPTPTATPSTPTPNPDRTVTSPTPTNTSPDRRQFLYFAYGSNLLRERLHLNNPSAVFVTTGRLEGHGLRFGRWREDWSSEVGGRSSWHGGVATVVEVELEQVWGAVWSIHLDHLTSLDRQEGVGRGFYSPREVTIQTDRGELLCRTYLMNNYSAILPSPPYKQVVCLGAKQSGLPLDYIHQLEAVETNGYNGPSILDDIVAPPVSSPSTSFPRPSERQSLSLSSRPSLQPKP